MRVAVNRSVRTAIQYGTLIGWLVGGSYLGLAGWVAVKALEETSTVRAQSGSTAHEVEYHGHVFRDEESVLDFIHEQRSTRIAPWIFELPGEMIPLLACIGIGVVGGAARLLKVLALDSRPLTSRRLLGDPLFGGVIGVFVVVVAWTLPTMITTAKGPVRAESLAALSLCGGFFSEHAFQWLERAAKKLFAR
jgi:hypothetical protein